MTPNRNRIVKKLLIISFMLFYPLLWREAGGEAYAKKTVIDSFLTELPKQKEDTNKVKLLNNLSLQVGNYDTALYYAQQAKQLAEKLKWKKGIGNALRNEGSAYEVLGNYSSALDSYFAALKVFEEIDHRKGTADSYNDIGNVYESQGNYPEALKNYFASLKIFEEIGHKKGTASLYNNIGIIYSNHGNYPESLKNYFAALKIFEETGTKQGIANVYDNIGVIYYKQGNYPEALKNYFASLKIEEEIGNKEGVTAAYGNIGSIYAKQGNYPEALKNYFATLKIFEEVGDKHGMAEIYNNIGNVYTKQNRAIEGKEWQQKALKLSKEIGAKDLIKNAYEGLVLADSTLGNFNDVYENYKMYVLYKDSLFNEGNTKKLTQSAMQYDFDKKEATVKAEQEKKDAITKLVRNVLIVGLVAILIFATVFFKQRNKIAKGKQKSDELLHNILPAEVAIELKAKGNAAAKQYNDVSILFTDFVNFTQTTEILSPEELVQELHECFTAFDEITDKHNIEKIKTIGDAYLAVCGLPNENPNHAQNTVQAALEICNFIAARKQQFGDRAFDIRIGVHSGSVVAGIVGVKKFAYDIWGDTVNTASRMESSSKAGKVNISESTYQLVKDYFTCTHRGKITAKGKGEIDMYFVEPE